jgi:thiamine biosynthesis lipoprotein
MRMIRNRCRITVRGPGVQLVLSKPSAESVPSPARARPAPAHSLRRLRVALGTWVAIEASAQSEAIAAGAIEAAYAAVCEVERRMHPEREGSDIVRINSAALRVRTPIQASTWEVLRLARRLNELTRGVFDPCLPSSPGRLTDLELSGPLAGSAPWVVRRAPLALDLGGIAKGYAIDRAIAALGAAGCNAGAVNAGGDLRLFGARRETILLRYPDHSYLALHLQNAALAVSDLDEPRRPPGHRGYYVRTGAAGTSRRYAAVQAPDAMTADALTKCVLLCSEASARRTVAEWGGRDITHTHPTSRV